MKHILSLVFMVNIIPSFTQYNVGLIIGNAVRIRTEANVKSKEISKVYGQRKVTILRESDQWDDLGKHEMCSRYKWVQVQWHPDSIGWVYGKYCFKNEGISSVQNKQFIFGFNGSTYQIQLFQNYEYPVADEEGLTGCNNTIRVYLYEIKTNNYNPITDSFSKAEGGETTMVFYSNEGISEKISSIQSNGDKINIHVEISYQEGSNEADYVIRRFNGEFKVISYKLGVRKY